jgi:hypothetical protein
LYVLRHRVSTKSISRLPFRVRRMPLNVSLDVAKLENGLHDMRERLSYESVCLALGRGNLLGPPLFPNCLLMEETTLARVEVVSAGFSFSIAAKRHSNEVALRRCDDSRASSERHRRAPLLEGVCSKTPQTRIARRGGLGPGETGYGFPTRV